MFTAKKNVLFVREPPDRGIDSIECLIPRQHPPACLCIIPLGWGEILLKVQLIGSDGLPCNLDKHLVGTCIQVGSETKVDHLN